MKQFIELLNETVGAAFEKAGFDKELGRVSVSNRPDLCEYQCNGAMSGAKLYHKKPIEIAEAVAAELSNSDVFEKVSAVMPGFLNLDISARYISDYVSKMLSDDKFGYENTGKQQTIVIDYGGPNVAKPLHVGHLRPAIIGESIKRISRYAGHKVIGDVHLGDWGMPMGQIITELKERKPELPYFDDSFDGEYPEEAPFTISELEEIYPTASGKCKTDEEYKKKALQNTKDLQDGKKGYRALWQQVLKVSVADLKRNYEKLDVSFDLWMGESDVDDMIPAMVEKMKADGHAHLSEGALVVDIAEESDKKELPPCIVLKSDGASNYETTDLATIKYREDNFNPDAILYVVDKRQELHFIQVFRTARKCGLAKEDTSLEFIGFGTMNGPGGKPFKTRDGGVLRLETLLSQIKEGMFEKIKENKDMSDEDADKTAAITALAAVKYGDLSNQASKDYVFDTERFTAFEGDTGPYLLYTMVRIKSILSRFKENGGDMSAVSSADILYAANACAAGKDVLKDITGFSRMIDQAFEERAPHRVCAFAYKLANDFNSFYHEVKILAEEDDAKKNAYIALLEGVLKLFETCIELLGFECPDKM
ncbi:MAG: arginine--tRNA ligase [Lachnospiraceae bacterium]|nr:arginine--tRNA ligase [Lachnospiraceae bacterium]